MTFARPVLNDRIAAVIYTIYEHPPDLPLNVAFDPATIHAEGYVARRWKHPDECPFPDPWALHGDTIDDIRAALPPGLNLLTRLPGDHPAIVESWVWCVYD